MALDFSCVIHNVRSNGVSLNSDQKKNGAACEDSERIRKVSFLKHGDLRKYPLYNGEFIRIENTGKPETC